MRNRPKKLEMIAAVRFAFIFLVLPFCAAGYLLGAFDRNYETDYGWCWPNGVSSPFYHIYHKGDRVYLKGRNIVQYKTGTSVVLTSEGGFSL